MSQSLSAVYIHLIYSTKDRRPLLRETNHRNSVHAKLASISTNLGCPTIKVGGVEDHVHLLGRLGRTIALAHWVKEVKRISSLFIKGSGREFRNFQWQGGYAAFSVCHSHLVSVARYIANQEEHHKKLGFQDELRAIFKKHQIDFDERYVWD